LSDIGAIRETKAVEFDRQFGMLVETILNRRAKFRDDGGNVWPECLMFRSPADRLLRTFADLSFVYNILQNNDLRLIFGPILGDSPLRVRPERLHTAPPYRQLGTGFRSIASPLRAESKWLEYSCSVRNESIKTNQVR
jgi:hypothetical protein